MMDQSNEELEISLLLTAIKQKYDVDYTNYRSAYIRRRIEHRMRFLGLQSITALTNQIIHDEQAARALLKDISINVTDMFRCPEFFKELKKEIVPILKTYPSVRIWHAGCSTGEEVLSMAILLKEEGILNRTSILATDNNEDVLEIAKRAIFPASRLRDWTENYTDAGGEESFSTYYDVKYNQAKFDESLLDRVTFKKHNLLEDLYPKDFHLVICRNVLIYFNEENQRKVVHKFHLSLKDNGYIGLGLKESIKRENLGEFKAVSSRFKIYQKVFKDA